MLPVATDVARNVVSVLVTLMYYAKRQNRSRCRLGKGLTHVGPVNHVLDGGRDSRSHHGDFWGVVRPTEKHRESLLRCTQQKDSILSNGTTCDAAFCQNSLTTFFRFWICLRLCCRPYYYINTFCGITISLILCISYKMTRGVAVNFFPGVPKS